MECRRIERKLTSKQLESLEVLYKFRFITAELLAKQWSKPLSYPIYAHLSSLEKNGLIGRNYSGHDRLNNKPASYYLLPKAFKAFTANNIAFDERIRKQIYKDKNASPAFIHTCLLIFDATLRLTTKSHSQAQVYTKSLLTAFDYLPAYMPDTYLFEKIDAGRKHSFIYVVDSAAPVFVTLRRISDYVTYRENETWKAATGGVCPDCLIVVEEDKNLSKITDKVNKLLYTLSTDLEDSHIVIKALESL